MKTRTHNSNAIGGARVFFLSSLFFFCTSSTSCSKKLALFFRTVSTSACVTVQNAERRRWRQGRGWPSRGGSVVPQRSEGPRLGSMAVGLCVRARAEEEHWSHPPVPSLRQLSQAPQEHARLLDQHKGSQSPSSAPPRYYSSPRSTGEDGAKREESSRHSNHRREQAEACQRQHEYEHTHRR